MIVGLCIVCYTGGWWTYKLSYESAICCNYEEQIDSLEEQIDSLKKLTFLMEDEQCLYYGKSKNEILAMSAKVAVDTGKFYVFKGKVDGVIDFRSTWIDFRHPQYRDKIITATDTLWFYFYSMENPFNYRNKLDILFEKTDSGWYANSCVEYNPENNQF